MILNSNHNYLMHIKCKQCGNNFAVEPYRANSAQFCSRRCFGLFKVGKPHKHRISRGWKWSVESKRKLSKSNQIALRRFYASIRGQEFKQEMSKRLKGKFKGSANPFFGKTHTSSVRKRLSIAGKARVQDKHPNWKGKQAKYRAIHMRIVRLKGKAKQCSVCGITNTRIHWANRNHKYTMNLKDWIELCVLHHNQFDKTHGLR